MSKVVAVGALGGSGTRAVAQVLIDASVYMGDELNKENDNLIFTRLFKDPEWYRHASEERTNERLAVFEQYMELDCLTLKNASELLKSDKDNPNIECDILFYLKVIQKLLSRKKSRALWGWKEPNTQIYIDEIASYFSNIKYIHVIRHGLDMAFSSNKQQLNNWGYKYDIYLNDNEDKDELAYKQLDYWVKSTKDVLDKCKKLGDDFLLLNHTYFCLNPKHHVKEIIEFLSLEITQERINALSLIPKKPESLGRYKKYDLGVFDKSQIEYVKEMGFEV